MKTLRGGSYETEAATLPELTIDGCTALALRARAWRDGSEPGPIYRSIRLVLIDDREDPS